MSAPPRVATYLYMYRYIQYFRPFVPIALSCFSDPGPLCISDGSSVSCRRHEVQMNFRFGLVCFWFQPRSSVYHATCFHGIEVNLTNSIVTLETFRTWCESAWNHSRLPSYVSLVYRRPATLPVPREFWQNLNPRWSQRPLQACSKSVALLRTGGFFFLSDPLS